MVDSIRLKQEGDSAIKTAMDVVIEDIEVTGNSANRHKLTKHCSDFSDSGVGSQESKSMEVEDSDAADDGWPVLENTVGNSCSTVLPRKASSEKFEMEAQPLANDDVLPLGEDSPDFPESIASEAVRSCYSILAEVITNQVSLVHLGSELYAHSLIENTVLGKVETLGIPNEQKAAEILKAVSSKMRISDPDTQSLKIFVQILDKYPCCREITVMITTKYDELKQTRQCGTSYRQGQKEGSQVDCHELSTRYTSCFSPFGNGMSRQPIPEPSLHHMAESHHNGQSKTKSLLSRQHSLSSEEEPDVNMSEEDIRHELRRLKRFAKCMQNFVDRKRGTQCLIEEMLHRTELEVEERQRELEDRCQQLERCNTEKEVLKGQLQLARRQILQLNKEVLFLKKPKQQTCTGTCEHKAECEKLSSHIKRLEEEKLEYMATVENLTQQRDLLLNTP